MTMETKKEVKGGKREERAGATRRREEKDWDWDKEKEGKKERRKTGSNGVRYRRVLVLVLAVCGRVFGAALCSYKYRYQGRVPNCGGTSGYSGALGTIQVRGQWEAPACAERCDWLDWL